MHEYAAPDQFNIAEAGHANTFVPESTVVPARDLINARRSTSTLYEEDGHLNSTAHQEHVTDHISITTEAHRKCTTSSRPRRRTMVKHTTTREKMKQKP